MTQRFNHYESSVAEHVRIWSNQTFIDTYIHSSLFFHFAQRFNHYESSVAEHVRIWSNQTFIDTKLGTFTQVYFSTFCTWNKLPNLYFLYLAFVFSFSWVIRIIRRPKHFPYFVTMFLLSNFFGRKKWFGQLARTFWANGKQFQNLFVKTKHTELKQHWIFNATELS